MMQVKYISDQSHCITILKVQDEYTLNCNEINVTTQKNFTVKQISLFLYAKCNFQCSFFDHFYTIIVFINIFVFDLIFILVFFLKVILLCASVIFISLLFFLKYNLFLFIFSFI